uniref:Uncharacterized protein n=1 Tax=Rhizophora mucronata TaxID=61149 RepID=A0A2P2L9U0_RHIMU
MFVLLVFLFWFNFFVHFLVYPDESERLH